MMLKQKTLGSLVVLLAGLIAGAAHAEGWTVYKAEKFGFSMLVPEGTKFAEKEYKNGWGRLYAVHGPLKVYALGKLGDAETPKAIQKFGVRVTKIHRDHWKLIDEGKDSRGWKWFRTVKAEHEGTVVFGGYGIGPKGNYMMLLKTTADDFKAHEADYMTWYKSINLQ